MDSRSDSLAAKLQRGGLLDEYFAWWLAERPSIAARKKWLQDAGLPHSNDAIHNLHRSPEAAMWRNAAAARARAALDAGLPKNIDSLIRKSLLDQRFNAVMGDLSHKELMDQLSLEGDAERLAIKREELALKKEALRISRQRLLLDKARGQLQRVAEQGLTAENKDGVAALLSELEALGVK